MTWREYHQATIHTPESLRRATRGLDWANIPDPFRHYEGLNVLDLPADPSAQDVPALKVLLGERGQQSAFDGPEWLSQLLFHSAAISASKRVPSTGFRYSLRVNPSSGNLHPTEFHFLTRGLLNWPDGIYHYRPSSHMAEQRALGTFDVNPAAPSAPIVFLLSAIVWREAWKYGPRAYRYCLHDIGHAWQSVALAARAGGCETVAAGAFPDDEVSRFWHLNEDERPMLFVRFDDKSIPLRMTEAASPAWFDGRANKLSDEEIEYPLIERMHAATKVVLSSPGVPPNEGSGAIALPPPATSERAFGELVRARRSALDFRGGAESMSLPQLSAILATTNGGYSADFAATGFVQLWLYVHRVNGLEPGVYRYWPKRGELERVRSGDQRVAAAGLSLGQDLAGNACVAFSMIADLERATRMYGDRGYRYAHFEAGAIGQRLYLAAEAFGLRGTGIGAFFDDRVHSYLGLHPAQGQVIYHFAIGHPVFDSRLGE